VIGSTVSGVAATTTSSAIDGTLAAVLTSGLSSNFNAGVSAVPEAGTVVGVALGACLALFRRRRA
jgi:hypothetical protein